MSSIVENERHKLLANLFNGLAIASAVAGAVVPAAGAFYGLGSAPAFDKWLPIGLLLWIAVAGILHFAGRISLRRLR